MRTTISRGFTLIELVVVLGIFVLILTGLLALFLSFYRIYNSQEATVRVAGSASMVGNELQNTLLQADQVMASHAFTQGTYNSSTTTLVAEMPAVDSSGSVISGKYDYVAFYLAGTNFYKLAQPDASSSRASALTLLSDTVTGVTFTYNTSTLSQVTEVSAAVQTQAAAGKLTVPFTLNEQIYFRNR